ncbi:hypothetical protein C8F04DRAFT_1178340 [Mycena alexandri]|uniref:Uncharacterized protein n=1 Tax=Mycena alexandri TaxID=1745969 RepID=A0AAD6T5T7_9AGAR|nr:hypothetical protein C8F04DRAFT_1178340 [Mycena alexandri]
MGRGGAGGGWRRLRALPGPTYSPGALDDNVLEREEAVMTVPWRKGGAVQRDTQLGGVRGLGSMGVHLNTARGALAQLDRDTALTRLDLDAACARLWLDPGGERNPATRPPSQLNTRHTGRHPTDESVVLVLVTILGGGGQGEGEVEEEEEGGEGKCGRLQWWHFEQRWRAQGRADTRYCRQSVEGSGHVGGSMPWLVSACAGKGGAGHIVGRWIWPKLGWVATGGPDHGGSSWRDVIIGHIVTHHDY